jgi:hypothetical protein
VCVFLQSSQNVPFDKQIQIPSEELIDFSQVSSLGSLLKIFQALEDKFDPNTVNVFLNALKSVKKVSFFFLPIHFQVIFF